MGSKCPLFLFHGLTIKSKLSDVGIVLFHGKQECDGIAGPSADCSVQCALCSTVYSVYCSVFSTVYSVQCAVQCAV